MFERVVLRRSLDGPAITAGEIAEALLFYQNVHIVLDYSSLVGLIKTIGMRLILRVLSLPDVKATYIEEITGTRTEQTLSGPEYSLIAFMFTGHKDRWAPRIAQKETRVCPGATRLQQVRGETTDRALSTKRALQKAKR